MNADFKYTIEQPNMVRAHFDDFQEVTEYVEELTAKRRPFTFIDNTASAAAKPKKAKVRGIRCEASGYRLVGRDFYSVTEKDGQHVCDTCGKAIKIAVRNGNEYIPVHNEPTA